MEKNDRPMSEPRPAASLTPNLLARRGDARPAMRRQPLANLHMPLAAHEDLGWNDVGESEYEPAPPTTSLAAMSPPDSVDPFDELEWGDAELPAEPPAASAPEPVPAPPISPLTRQLEAIAQRISQTSRDESGFKPMAAKKISTRAGANHPGIGAAVASASIRKAAFTLRLNPERHLRLRLLSAVTHRSAQYLLIEALDALLDGHDQVEDLAHRVEIEGEQSPKSGAEAMGLKRPA